MMVDGRGHVSQASRFGVRNALPTLHSHPLIDPTNLHEMRTTRHVVEVHRVV